MSALLAGLYLLAAIAGTVVVVTRDHTRQAFSLGVFGTILAVLFFALQAPDVALSQLAVGTVATPFMILVTVTRIGRLRK